MVIRVNRVIKKKLSPDLIKYVYIYICMMVTNDRYNNNPYIIILIIITPKIGLLQEVQESTKMSVDEIIRRVRSHQTQLQIKFDKKNASEQAYKASKTYVAEVQ